MVNANFIAGVTRIIEECRDKAPAFFDDVHSFIERAEKSGIPFVIITKGELHHQQDKIAALEEYLGGKKLKTFVLGDKTEDEYLKVVNALSVRPEEFLMMGDSVVSDVTPVLEIGGQAIHLERPATHGVKWAFEKAQLPLGVKAASSLTEVSMIIKEMTARKAVPAESAKRQQQPK